MPKVEKEQWYTLDIVSKWLLSTRAAVLIMTFMAAALAGLIAWRDGVFSFPIWAMTAIGLIFAHATNNLINDLVDSNKGIDKNNYYRNQYGVHVIEDGLMSRDQFWTMLAITGGIAIFAGLWLVNERSGLTFDLMLAGAFFVLFYTWPLKYYGLGEPAVLAVWGPLMIGGTYYVMAGEWSWPITWLSFMFALGPTCVLFGKHTDKMDIDEGKKVRTLPVILGEATSRKVVKTMFIAQYALSVYLVVSGAFHWALLLVFLNYPMLKRVLSVYSSPKPEQEPENHPTGTWPLWFASHAFAHNRKFSSLFLLGVLIDVVLH